MTTQADQMLMQAMLMLGQGGGAALARRRMTKEREKEAQQFFPNMPGVGVQTQPEGQALIAAMMGGMPGGAGMAKMITAANQASTQGQIDERIGAANQQNDFLRQAYTSKDPMMRQIAGSALAQQFAPKEPKVIPTTGGTFIQRGQDLQFVPAPEKKLKPGEQFEEFGGNLYDTSKIDEDGKPKLVFEGTPETKYMEIGYGDPKERLRIKAAFRNGKFVDYAGEPYRQGDSTQTVINASDLTKPNITKGQQDLMTADTQMAAFNDIMDSYEPKFLTWGDKVWRFVQSGIDKAGLSGVLSAEDQKEYQKAVTFKQNTWKAVNSYIKAITGAQMSEKEVPRILQSIANTADSPMAFEAKMKQSMSVVNETRTRYEEYLSQGIVPAGYESVVAESYGKYKDVYAKDEALRLAQRDATQRWASDQIESGLSSIESEMMGQERKTDEGGPLPGMPW